MIVASGRFATSSPVPKAPNPGSKVQPEAGFVTVIPGAPSSGRLTTTVAAAELVGVAVGIDEGGTGLADGAGLAVGSGVAAPPAHPDTIPMTSAVITMRFISSLPWAARS